MATRNADIRINTTADTKGADAAAASMKKVGDSAETAGNKTKSSGDKMLRSFGGVGAQLQDVVVQAQMGTNASTILLQQGSQLLGAFGPQGMIAGALLALGTVIYKGMTAPMQKAEEEMRKTIETGGKLAETLAGINKEIGARESAEFARELEQTAAATDAANEAALAYMDTRGKLADIDDKLATSQDGVTAAAIRYLSAIGQVKDEESALLALRERAEERARAAAERDAMATVDAANEKLRQAQDRVEIVRESEAKLLEQINALEAERTAASQRLDAARASDARMVAAGAPEGYMGQGTAPAANEVARLESAIKGIQSQIDQKTAATDQALSELTSAATEQFNAMATAKAKVDEINQTFADAQTVQELETATTKSADTAKQITEGVAKFEPINQQQQTAKDALLAAAADGKVTADETAGVARNLQTLLNTLQSSQKANASTLQGLVSLNRDTTAALMRADADIKGLQQQIKALGGGRR